MSYLTQQTPEEERRSQRDALVLKVAEAVNHLASTLLSVNKDFYSVDPEQLVADLNEDLATSLGLMGANAALGKVVNDHLDSLDIAKYSKRVPLIISHDEITFDGSKFVYTKRPEPEIIEEIEE